MPYWPLSTLSLCTDAFVVYAVPVYNDLMPRCMYAAVLEGFSCVFLVSFLSFFFYWPRQNLSQFTGDISSAASDKANQSDRNNSICGDNVSGLFKNV